MIERWADALRPQIAGWLRDANTPGVAIALVECGQPAIHLCQGRLSAGDERAVTEESVFEAASLSKPVFAALALLLAERGALDLDAPLQPFLAEELVPGDSRAAQITARMALSQRSGLPNWFNPERPRALIAPPGERFGYSGEGYFQLQRAVEALCGRGLEDLAAEFIFNPLGMARSAYHRPGEYALETTCGHNPEGHPLPVRADEGPNAGHSLHTTCADMARFLAWRLTSPVPTLETPIDALTGWSLGWGLKRVGAVEGKPVWLFWQWGDNSGYKHLAVGDPISGRGVCVLTNGERGYEVWKLVLAQTLDPHAEIFTWLSQL